MFTIEESKRDAGVHYILNEVGRVVYIGHTLDDCLAFARGIQREARQSIHDAKIARERATAQLRVARNHDEEARELISLITKE